MPTTTIRIEDELKARIAALAQRAGKTSHAFILEAISETVREAEEDAEFHRIASERWESFLRTGKSIPWGEARAYLEARARGEKPPRPVARKFSR